MAETRAEAFFETRRVGTAFALSTLTSGLR